MTLTPTDDYDGTVDGAGLVYEAVAFTSSLEKIDPSGKIQAIFTNLGAALMWKTAILKGITREDIQPAFHELNNQTRQIMNHERPAASLVRQYPLHLDSISIQSLGNGSYKRSCLSGAKTSTESKGSSSSSSYLELVSA